MKTIIDNSVTTKQKDIIEKTVAIRFNPVDVKLVKVEQRDANRWKLTFSTTKDWMGNTIIRFIEDCYFKAEYME